MTTENTEQDKSTEADSREEVLVMPEFMGKPTESFACRSGVKMHSYSMPEEGEDIIKAIHWMMSVYDDVVCEYGPDYDCPYCCLVGTVKKA